MRPQRLWRTDSTCNRSRGAGLVGFSNQSRPSGRGSRSAPAPVRTSRAARLITVRQATWVSSSGVRAVPRRAWRPGPPLSGSRSIILGCRCGASLAATLPIPHSSAPASSPSRSRSSTCPRRRSRARRPFPESRRASTTHPAASANAPAAARLAFRRHFVGGGRASVPRHGLPCARCRSEERRSAGPSPALARLAIFRVSVFVTTPGISAACGFPVRIDFREAPPPGSVRQGPPPTPPQPRRRRPR